MYLLLVVYDSGKIEVRQEYKTLSAACIDAEWYEEAGFKNITITKL